MCPDARNEGHVPESYFPPVSGWAEIVDAQVKAAFRRVERSRFVPADMRPYVHRDEPIPIGEGQTCSQPYVIALMLQALQLAPGDRVLEIGTGSGYQTALLCELVRTDDSAPGATVYSLERYPSLLEGASQALAACGYAPHLKVGDGGLGWAEHAPWQAIIVSAAASAVPRPLIAQLADGGRIVIPVGLHESDQELWLVRRTGDRLHWWAMGPVRFVPLVTPVLKERSQQVHPSATFV